jgi:hypothetical protein
MLSEHFYSSPSSSIPPASFSSLPAEVRFATSKPVSVKRIDFPVRPHLLKYLQVHLHLARVQEHPFKVSDYTLSSEGRFGLPLTLLFQRPAKSARHDGSIDDCTAMLGIDLRNFKGAYKYLLEGQLSPWVIFQFNNFVEDYFREEMYWWVNRHRERRATLKDAIYSFMAFYDVTEDDIPFETLRKDVQRNSGVKKNRKKKKVGVKTSDSAEKVSRKIGEVSRKKGEVSRKKGVLSQKDSFSIVRQQLMKLPLPLFETEFFHARS